MKAIYLTYDTSEVRIGDLIRGSSSPIWWTVTGVDQTEGWVFGKTVHSEYVMKLWVTSTSPAEIARDRGGIDARLHDKGAAFTDPAWPK